MDKSGDSPMNWDVEEFLRRFHILMDLGPLYWHEDGRRLLEITELDLSRT